MIWTVAIIIWCVVGWRSIFRLWYNDFKDLGWHLGDLALGMVVATTMCWVGFFALIPALFCMANERFSEDLAHKIGRVLAGESKTDRLDRMRQEKLRRDRKIQELERELNL